LHRVNNPIYLPLHVSHVRSGSIAKSKMGDIAAKMIRSVTVSRRRYRTTRRHTQPGPRIMRCQPSHSSFPNHVGCLNALQGSPRALKRSVALGEPGSFLYVSVVLLNHIIQIRIAGSEHDAADCRRLSGLQRWRVRRIPVDIHDSRHHTAGCLHRPDQKTFGCGGVPPRHQQKNRSSGRWSQARDTGICPRP
jgi:hypothetical protein